MFIYCNRIWYGHADITQAICGRFRSRKTHIMAYELTIANVAVPTLDVRISRQVYVRRYINNKPARSRLEVSHSKQSDLHEMVGMVRHTVARRALPYWSGWVQSKKNLTDV